MKYTFLTFAILFSAVFLFVGTTNVFAATLSLSPSAVGYNAGDFFDVNIVLNTQGASVDGVDIRYLNYNPSLLEVQDADSGVAGVQITAGALMPMSIINSVDTAAGKIQFSQSSIGGSSYNGTGNLATIRFKALSAGTASVSFDYASGNTTDTNIASGGADVLNAVTNGSYVISSVNSGGGSTGGSGGGGSGGGSSSGGTSGGGGGSSVGGYVSNNIPNLPSSVRQFVNNGLITLSEGEQTNDTTIYFKAVISDPDNDQVKFRVEIRPIADNFTGLSDGGILETALMPSGSTASIARGGLSNGAYKWRYQIIDSNGGATAWQEFGYSGNTDFIIGSQAADQPIAQSTAVISSATDTHNFNKDLQYGLKGDSDVKQLQKVLSAEGLYSNDESLMTGNFFSMTKDAVVKFQQKYDISPTSGYVGPLTRSKLNSLYGGTSSSAASAAQTNTAATTATTTANTNNTSETINNIAYNFNRNLQYGLKGDSDVKQLQKVLSAEGLYSNDESLMTGNFFSMTKDAVVKFQQKYDISPTSGYVGPLTRSKLNSLYGGTSSSAASAAESSTAQASSSASSIFTRSLYLGIRGDDVMKLQDVLTKEGVYNGYVGGYYGPLTEAAVLKFQNKYGISGANGIFGPKTRAKLIELYPSL